MGSNPIDAVNFNSGAHHGDETHSEEGSEGEAPGQDRREEVRQGSEGARPVNLTLTQAFHRTQTLSGEFKAAESALTDCEDDAKAKERIASIAAEAVEKAKANLQALKDERAELAEHMATLVRGVGATTPEDRHAYETERFEAEKAAALDGAPLDFTDFGHPTQNGLDDSAVTAAFDRSTHP